MARARSTFGKLQREQEKRSRAQAKLEDRLARRASEPAPTRDDAPAEDQSALLEQFARLHEDLAEGRISLETFETRQEALRSRLLVD